MLFHVAADLLVVFHFLFVIFVLFGGLLILKWRFIMWLHIPAVVWGVVVEWMGWICPLTPWEWSLREKAGQLGYSGSFIDYYIIPIIYPEGLTRELQVSIGIFVILINLIVYGFIFYKFKR